LDFLGAEMGDVGEGAGLDLTVVAVGFAEQDGGRGVAVGDGGDVHAYILSHNNHNYKHNIVSIHAYRKMEKTPLSTQNKRLQLIRSQNFGLKVEGPESELRIASREYGNHPLALTLLGTFLTRFHDRDVRRRSEVRALLAKEGKPYEHARRMIAAYDRMFAGKQEGAILRALGYFDRPAEREVLKLVMPIWTSRNLRPPTSAP